MQSSIFTSCLWTSALFIVAERFIGNVELALNANTIERFILAWVSCYIAYYLNPMVINTMPSLATSSPLLSSVLAGGIYVGLDHFTKLDPSSPMYKWLYLTGSSVVVNYASPYLMFRS
jgi:hypothetical protein